MHAYADACVALAAQPATSADYAMGYAEGFNDACKPAPAAVPLTDEQIEKIAPVAWMLDTTGGKLFMATDAKHDDDWLPLYTHPPTAPVRREEFSCPYCFDQPAPVPLTDERASFEVWAASVLGDNPHWRESGPCELAWQAWQSCIRTHGIGDKP
jgi:hypothetical protein